MAVIRRLLDSRLVWSLLACGLCVSLGRIAVRGLARDPRFLAWPHEVRATAPPWGGPEVIAPVRAALQRLGPQNLFDPRFEPRLRAALGRLAGVASVDRVRRLWPDRYSLSLTLRRPVAVVLDGGRRIPVTADAVALPLAPFERASRGLLRIVGVEEPAPPAAGTWRSERLRDGIAAVLQIEPFRDELNRLGLGIVDVSRAEDPIEGVVLRGHDGILVRWGRPRALVGENGVERKIGYLRLAARHVDQVLGREIDVRYSDIYVRQAATP